MRSGRQTVDPARARVTLAKYSVEWLADRPLRDRTREVYASILRVDIVPSLGDHRLDGITAHTVRRWHAELLKSKPTMAPKAYRLLRTILTTAVDDGVLAENPCRVKGAASERAAERSIPTVAEVEAIVDAIDDRFRAAVVLAAYCGLRKGECFGLARRHVQLDGTRPSVRIERTRSEVAGRGLVFQPPKTDAGSRVVSLPERVSDELAQHLDRFVPNDAEALLFADPATGDVPRASRWTRIWNSARQRAGVADNTFHDLRHLAGTLTALAGGTLKEIQARLGHSSPDAAMIYQHVAHGRDDALAAEIDRIIGVPVP